MNKLLFSLAFIMISFSAFAQLDRADRSTSVEGLGIPAEKSGLDIPRVEKKEENNSLFNRRRNPITLSDGEEDKGFSMLEDNGLIKERKLENFTPKAFTKDKPIKDEYSKGDYLGEYATGGTYVEVYMRDHEYVDGDRVRIFVNGVMVANNVSLGSGYYPVLVTLKKGPNTIEFEALNMGTSGPNTAELIVYDDMGQVLTQNEWNLTTGVKASLVVVKK